MSIYSRKLKDIFMMQVATMDARDTERACAKFQCHWGNVPLETYAYVGNGGGSTMLKWWFLHTIISFVSFTDERERERETSIVTNPYGPEKANI